MKKIKTKIIITVLKFIGVSFSQPPLEAEITKNEIKYHINYLASEELEGRMTGTDELYNAAVYLKNEFERYGLLPFFEGSYFQKFPFMAGIELGKSNFLSVKTADEQKDLTVQSDFIPLSFTENLSVSG